MDSEGRVTAAVMIIGDEILSGRTQDTNLRDIARHLGTYGVEIAEARVVPDVESDIVETLNLLRANTTTWSPPAASVRRTTTSPPTAWPWPSG